MLKNVLLFIERGGETVGGNVNSIAVILIVDDNYFNRELLNVYLSSSGYTVIEACNGNEAVKVATIEHPDLIIMDLTMPVMDGYGAVRILRKVPEICDIPYSLLAQPTILLLTVAKRRGWALTNT